MFEQTSVFEAAQMFPAWKEFFRRLKALMRSGQHLDEAMKCKETGEKKTIVFGLTGTGYFDMFAYGRYNDGEMSDYIPTDAELQAGFDGIPKI